MIRTLDRWALLRRWVGHKGGNEDLLGPLLSRMRSSGDDGSSSRSDKRSLGASSVNYDGSDVLLLAESDSDEEL